MELQLGLALPGNSIKGFDLNSYFYEPREVLGSNPLNLAMLQLGPCISANFSADKSSNNDNKKKKRSFDEAFEWSRGAVPPTLPLLLWNYPPDEDDDPKDLDKNSDFDSKRNDGDVDCVVGWPPIKAWRKKRCHQNHGGRAENYKTLENGRGNYAGRRQSNSLYVKVKMEGVAIIRKIDINLYHSFQTLTNTLLAMFGECEENSNCYKLTYQDREGDWLLAQDVPWRTFIGSVQRLKLQRKNA